MTARVCTSEEYARELAEQDREEFASISSRVAVALEGNPSCGLSAGDVVVRATIAAGIIAAARRREVAELERMGERPSERKRVAVAP